MQIHRFDCIIQYICRLIMLYLCCSFSLLFSHANYNRINDIYLSMLLFDLFARITPHMRLPHTATTANICCRRRPSPPFQLSVNVATNIVAIATLSVHVGKIAEVGRRQSVQRHVSSMGDYQRSLQSNCPHAHFVDMQYYKLYWILFSDHR
jgi:hypothetical protein